MLIDSESRRNQTIKEHEADKDIFESVDQSFDRLKEIHITKIKNQHSEIMEQIKTLQEEKRDLLDQPLLKEEFLKEFKEQVELNKAELRKELTKYLSEYHERNVTPFPLSDVLYHYSDTWKILFFALTDKDIEDMVSNLPHKGRCPKEIRAKVNKIEGEINRLQNTLPEELNQLQK